jgi:hypothetical protein
VPMSMKTRKANSAVPRIREVQCRMRVVVMRQVIGSSKLMEERKQLTLVMYVPL